MQLGTFSVSLSVADLEKSKQFYGALGFATFHDQSDSGYVILRNGEATIGLFQGMFDDNILTFNPGWNAQAETLESFTDIREIQQHLLDSGLKLDRQIDDKSTSGPASIVLVDPDGNPVLIDQHV